MTIKINLFFFIQSLFQTKGLLMSNLESNNKIDDNENNKTKDVEIIEKKIEVNEQDEEIHKKMQQNKNDDESEIREIVLPGDFLGTSDQYRAFASRGTYQYGKNIYSNRIGVFRKYKNQMFVVPLRGPYIPQVGDLIIGKVINVSFTSWLVDIRSGYTGILQATVVLGRKFNSMTDDLRKFIDIGDMIVCDILAFNRTRDPILGMKGGKIAKLSKKGKIIQVIPARIPRLIGKKSSMAKLFENIVDCQILIAKRDFILNKKKRNCQMVIAQNGMIYLPKMEKERQEFIIKIIRTIESEAHTSGLTDKIKKIIEEEGQPFIIKEKQVKK